MMARWVLLLFLSYLPLRICDGVAESALKKDPNHLPIQLLLRPGEQTMLKTKFESTPSPATVRQKERTAASERARHTLQIAFPAFPLIALDMSGGGSCPTDVANRGMASCVSNNKYAAA
jgi:hypothetical protein